MLKKALIVILKLLASIVLIINILFTIPYVFTTQYNFPKPLPFQGDSLVNPYQNIDSTQIPLKANFHAHTKAWGGLSNGHNSVDELILAYNQRKYAVAGVSNYFNILDSTSSKSVIYIPVYEHGINLRKHHKLGINASRVVWFDYFYFQNTSHKQDIINKLNKVGASTAIAHPKFLDGHTHNDLTQLTNYRLLEVLNHYRISDTYWDVALGAGRLVYILGNDDTHDIEREPTFVMWNEVYTDFPTKTGVLNALNEGKNIGVHAPNQTNDIKLNYLKVAGDTVKFSFNNVVDSVYVYSNNTLIVNSFSTYNNTFTLDKKHPYCRIVAKSKNATVYLNPIIRSVNGNLKAHTSLTATINQTQTWLHRLVAFVVLLLLLWATTRLLGLKLFGR